MAPPTSTATSCSTSSWSREFHFHLYLQAYKPIISFAAFVLDWKLVLSDFIQTFILWMTCFKSDSIKNINVTNHKSNPQNLLSGDNHPVENPVSKQALFLDLFHFYWLGIQSCRPLTCSHTTLCNLDLIHHVLFFLTLQSNNSCSFLHHDMDQDLNKFW